LICFSISIAGVNHVLGKKKMAVKISLFDKTGKVDVKLVNGKKYIITKDNFSTWERIEVEEN
jgi:hypothetical protein